MKRILHFFAQKVLFLLLCCFASTVVAQLPILLKNINTTLDGSPREVMTIGNTVYFSARNKANGDELWKTNGTPQGTVMVKDINPGPNGSNPFGFCNLNGTLFFRAQDNLHGNELWKSDGTEAGTVMVKDIHPGGSGIPANLFAIGNELYFTANDGVSGVELWKSDGSALGTKLVKDINPAGADSNPLTLTNLNGVLYFSANNGINGRELWKSDGTPSGTKMVKDINLNGNSDPGELTVFGNQLFFTASKSVNGVFDRELWKTSDGTEVNTVRVKEINRFGPDIPHQLMVFNNALYFTASSEGHGVELFKSDGTEVGTSHIPTFDIVPGLGSASPNNLVVANNTLFFTAKTASGEELWKVTTDDVASLVADIRPGAGSSEPRMLRAASGNLFFTADDGIHGRELWKSDGTSQGTVMVQDFVVGAGSAQIAQINGRQSVRGADLFFSSNGPNGFELRRSDGTVNGIVSLLDIGSTASNPAEFTKFGSLTYFSADDDNLGRELWKTDGTLAGTVLVADLIPGAEGSNPNNLMVVTAANGSQTLFFIAKDPVKGTELFKLESTPNAIPVCISDIASGLPSSDIRNLTNVNGILYFTASKTEGNAHENRIFKVNANRTDVVPVTGVLSSADNLVALSSVVYFTQKPQNGQPKLCKLANGTITILKSFDTLSNGESSVPEQLTLVGTTLFFTAADNAKGRELWKLEFAANAVPTRISDIRPNSADAGISNMTVFEGLLHFTALVDGSPRIFKTNEQRTKVLKTGGNMSNAGNLTVSGSNLFFTQNPAGNAPKLCRLQNGLTIVLKTFELLPDGQSSIPQNLTAAGEKLFFTAADTQEGRELWESDGTQLGTMRISNIHAGIGNANILEMRLSGNDLFFSANDQVVGQEPWILVNALSARGDESDERLEKTAAFAQVTAEIKVYPNPSTDYCFVEFSADNMEGVLSLLSSTGQLIRSAQVSAGASTVEMNVRELPAGIYLVRFEQADKSVLMKKVVVK